MYASFKTTGNIPPVLRVVDIATIKKSATVPIVNTSNTETYSSMNLPSDRLHKDTMTEEEARTASQNMQIVSIGESAESIVRLKTFLRDHGTYSEEISPVMTLSTLRALKRYQFDHNLPQTGRTDIATQQFIRRDLMK